MSTICIDPPHAVDTGAACSYCFKLSDDLAKCAACGKLTQEDHAYGLVLVLRLVAGLGVHTPARDGLISAVGPRLRSPGIMTCECPAPLPDVKGYQPNALASAYRSRLVLQRRVPEEGMAAAQDLLQGAENV